MSYLFNNLRQNYTFGVYLGYFYHDKQDGRKIKTFEGQGHAQIQDGQCRMECNMNYNVRASSVTNINAFFTV